MVRWEFDWLLQGHKDDVKTLIIFLCLIHFQFLDWPCLWTQKPLGKKLLEIVDPRLYYIIIFDFFCVYYSLVICNVFTLLTQIFLYIRLIYLFFFPSTYSTPIHFFVLYPIYMWSNFLIKDSLFYSNILWTHQLFSDLRNFN